MGLETGDYIDDLNPAWPLGGDQISFGPHHFRLIKHVLQTTFPNFDGAVNISSVELNKVAIKDIENIFTLPSSGLTAGLVLSSHTPGIVFNRTTSALDEKNWRISCAPDELRIELVNDAGDTISYFARFNRNAMALVLAEVTVSSFKVVGALETTQPIHVENQDTTLSRSRAGHMAMEGVEIGYLHIPQNSKSVDYTCVLEDSGKHIFHPSGGGSGDTFTIPTNATVAYELGSVLTFVNRSASSLEIDIAGTDKLYLAGTTSEGPFDLSENGVASAIKVEATTWLISGTGLS